MSKLKGDDGSSGTLISSIDSTPPNKLIPGEIEVLDNFVEELKRSALGIIKTKCTDEYLERKRSKDMNSKRMRRSKGEKYSQRTFLESKKQLLSVSRNISRIRKSLCEMKRRRNRTNVQSIDYLKFLNEQLARSLKRKKRLKSIVDDYESLKRSNLSRIKKKGNLYLKKIQKYKRKLELLRIDANRSSVHQTTTPKLDEHKSIEKESVGSHSKQFQKHTPSIDESDDFTITVCSSIPKCRIRMYGECWKEYFRLFASDNKHGKIKVRCPSLNCEGFVVKAIHHYSSTKKTLRILFDNNGRKETNGSKQRKERSKLCVDKHGSKIRMKRKNLDSKIRK